MAFGQDAKSNATPVNGTNTISWSHTCGASANKLVVVICWRDMTTSGTSEVSTLTYNGVSLTVSNAKVNAVWAGNNTQGCEIWYMDSPPTGSAYTISCTLTESNDVGNTIIGVAISYVDAASGETGGYATGFGNTSTIEVDVSTNESGSEIVGGAAITNSVTLTENVDTTQEYEYNSGADVGWVGTMTGTGGTDTIGGTIGGNNPMGMAALEIRPAGAAAGDSTPYLTNLKRRKFQPQLVR